MDGLITGLLVAVIDIYIVLLFVRIFVTERERYDSVLGLVFTATDPIISAVASTAPLAVRVRHSADGHCRAAAAQGAAWVPYPHGPARGC